jgi:hypothetical protein
MMEQALNRLEYLLSTIPALLTAIDADDFSKKSSPSQWSKKEIIGHLIDSATNNHQRFVRAQFEHIPVIQYDQNSWVEFSFYQSIEAQQIISFWTIYNKQLLEIVKRIPKAKLTKQVNDGEKLLTLEEVFLDYVEHLEHHLRQVVDY